MAQTTGIAIGENASVSAVTAIAIGDNASASANTVQLGSGSSVYQLLVGTSQVVNASGKIPTASLAATSTAVTIHDWDGSQYVTSTLTVLTA